MGGSHPQDVGAEMWVQGDFHKLQGERGCDYAELSNKVILLMEADDDQQGLA